MKKSDLRRVMQWLGKRSYKARVKRFGIERIREIARENGKKGGRPRKPDSQVSQRTLRRLPKEKTEGRKQSWRKRK